MAVSHFTLSPIAVKKKTTPKNKNKQTKNQTVPDKQSPGDTGTCPVSSLVQQRMLFLYQM